jgi:4-hydroxy-L-threonine phosphate dehydrogenase PdxA
VAVTLGDPAGIGPELVAKLLSNASNLQKADIIVLADKSEMEDAIVDAGGVRVLIATEAGLEGVQILDDGTGPKTRGQRAEVSEAGGTRCLHQLRRALKMQEAGEIDAIVFAPLNKSSLKKAGMTQEDELRWFADQLNFSGTTSEINIAGKLWTGRVTSHIGIEEVAQRVTKERTLRAIELVHRLRYVKSELER